MLNLLRARIGYVSYQINYYVPALCTNHPSLLPIGCYSEPIELDPKELRQIFVAGAGKGQTILSEDCKSFIKKKFEISK